MSRTNFVLKKLRSRAGESIAETLVAVLIAAIALTMLASAIASSHRMITRTRSQMKAYYDATDVLVKRDVIPSESADILTKSTASLKIDAGETITIPVQSYKISAFTDNTVIAYYLEDSGTTP